MLKRLGGGISSIKAKKMGRPENSSFFTSEKQDEIRTMIIDKCPDSFSTQATQLLMG